MNDYFLEELLEEFRSMGGGVNILSNLFSLGITVLTIVAWWFLFKKAGEAGWKILIPFYNQYTMFKIAGKKKLFWPYLVGILVYGCSAIFLIGALLLLMVGVAKGSGFSEAEQQEWLGNVGTVLLISLFLAVISGILVFVLHIIRCIGLSKSFNVGGGFAAGIIFFPYIFLAIMAFSKDIYYYGEQGPGQMPPQYGQMPPQYGQMPPQYGQMPPQYGQVPPQYGQMPPQYGQMPPQYGQVPPQYGQTPPQYGQVPPTGGSNEEGDS